MKIDKPSKPLPTKSGGEAAARPAVKGNAAPPPAAEQTSVSFGSTAAQLQSMENSMSGTPVADAGKVAEIKQAISDGRFKVNSEVVAERLLQTVRDLIGNRA